VPKNVTDTMLKFAYQKTPDIWVQQMYGQNGKAVVGIGDVSWSWKKQDTSYNGAFNVYGNVSNKQYPDHDSILFWINSLQNKTSMNATIVPFDSKVCLTPGDGFRWPVPMPQVNMSRNVYLDNTHPENATLRFVWFYPWNGTADLPRLFTPGRYLGHWTVTAAMGVVDNVAIHTGGTMLTPIGNIQFPNEWKIKGSYINVYAPQLPPPATLGASARPFLSDKPFESPATFVSSLLSLEKSKNAE